MKDDLKSKPVINNRKEDENFKKHTINIPINMNDNCIEVMEKYYENEPITLNVKLERNNIKVFYKGSIIGTSDDYRFKNEKSFKVEEVEFNDTQLIIEIDDDLLENSKETFNSELEEYAIKKGYDKERLQYLKQCDISEKVLKNILEYFNPENDVKKPEVVFFDPSGKLIKPALIMVSKGKSLRLVGPKATGKNTMVDTISWILGRKIEKFPGSPYSDKGDLLGETALVPIVDTEGKTHIVTRFQENALVLAMKKGLILEMDEININNPATLALLHGPLDTSRSITISTGENIIADEKFICIATMNEGYMGTSKLNSALVDRMCPIYFEKTPKMSEVISNIRSNADKDELVFIDKVNKKMQQLARANELIENDPSSVRGWLDYLDLIEEGISRNDAVIMAVVNRLQDKNDRIKMIESLKMF